MLRRGLQQFPGVASSVARSGVLCRALPIHSTQQQQKRTFASEDEALMSLDLVLPHRPIFQKKMVQRVTLPGASGMFGVGKNHIPTIAELKPGVVTVEEPGKLERYFVSGGFAFVNPDSTCSINAVEACPVEHIDPDAAKNGVQHYTLEVAKATDEESRAKALIGLEVHKQMCFALGIAV